MREEKESLAEDLESFSPEERRMLIMIGIWAVLTAALGYGVGCLAIWALDNPINFQDQIHGDVVTLATIAFGILGGWFGFMTNR